MPEPPTGTVTFLFTDIEAHATLWEQQPAAMSRALARHDALVEGIVGEHDGHVVRPRGEGDSRFAVFARATDAVAAAAALQQALATEPWPTATPLRVRMALHTGEAELRASDYYGSAVNRCARLRAVAHGGQTLLSQATYDLVRHQSMPGMRLHDLGEHRLKDLQHPERIVQLRIDGLPADFPPLKTLDARPNNLPLQATPFIGRERDVATLRQRLLDPQVRLVTLTGPGGAGKTRLALQAAAELLDHFVDGVWLVELAPMHDPTQIPAAIAAVFGMSDTGGQPLIERLAAFLRPKQQLLVLDNFEQVLAAAPEVARLLASAAGLKVLVTSRAVLHLAAEHAFPVPPLGLPDRSQPPVPAALLQSDAVTLFLKRAQAVRPEFALTEATAPAVAEICARLDGLPLALELAAARSRLFAPQALLARLQPERARLQFLTGGARDLPARQQTIRDTIAWSHGLLSAAEQRLFRRLAVFVGGWTVEAAEAVCDIEGDLGLDALEGLTMLVEQSLVRQMEGPDGEPRFRRLETIREYAMEQLAASGESERLRARHAAYYLHVAEEAEPALGGPEQIAWLDRLDVEYLNLRAALDWLYRGSGREESLRLGAALAAYWFYRGYYQEGDQWLGRLVADRTGIAPAVQAKTLAKAGWLAFLVSDTVRGRALLEEAVALSRAVGERWVHAFALLQLANWVSTAEYSGVGLAVAQEAGDLSLVGFGQTVRAGALANQGQWEQARVEYEASVVVFRQIGHTFGMFWTHSMFAHQLYGRGLYDEAELCIAEALVHTTRLGHGPGIAICQRLLGLLAHARGEDTRAEALLAESLSGFRKSGHRFYTADTLVLLGMVALAQGDDREAMARLDEGLALFREIDDHGGIALGLQQAAQVARHRGKLERATALLTEAITLVRGTDIRHFEQLEGLAALAATHGDAVRAVRLFGAAEAQRSKRGVARMPRDQAGYEGDVTAARARLDEATWNAAWAAGRAMTLEQAIAYALNASPGDVRPRDDE